MQLIKQENNKNTRLNVLTEVTLRVDPTFFWYVTPYNLVALYRCFAEPLWLILRGREGNKQGTSAHVVKTFNSPKRP